MNKNNRKTLLDLALNVDGERMDDRELADDNRNDNSASQLSGSSGSNHSGHSAAEASGKTAAAAPQTLTVAKHQTLRKSYTDSGMLVASGEDSAGNVSGTDMEPPLSAPHTGMGTATCSSTTTTFSTTVFSTTLDGGAGGATEMATGEPEDESGDQSTGKIQWQQMEQYNDSLLDSSVDRGDDSSQNSLSGGADSGIRSPLSDVSGGIYFSAQTGVQVKGIKQQQQQQGVNENSLKKKKGSNWYNVLSPTYKSKSGDFKRNFKDLPKDERLVVDYSCALQKDILVHGRLYVTQNWICFYANIFRWETVLTIRCKDITAMTKEKTAKVIPNALQISTNTEKFFFTSFSSRDKTFLMLFRVWQNALMDQPMSAQELWQWVHYSYGDELGLTSSDDDYVAPQEDEVGLTQSKDQEEEGDEKNMKDPAEFQNGILNGDMGLLTAPSLGSENASMPNSSTEDVLHANHKETTPLTSPDDHHDDMPTDQGDTTEDDEGETKCRDHDHYRVPMLDQVYPMGVDHMFDLYFTDSLFYKQFISARKTFDLIQSSWPEEGDAEGTKTRQITYTLSLNYSIGPKSSVTTEKQTWQGFSKPGQLYVVDTEVVNAGVPYGDNFYVVNRYCMCRVSQHKARLRITSEVKYKKSMWGLVKNMIDKNAIAGLHEYFQVLDSHLRGECEKTEMASGQYAKKKVLRRRRAHSSHGDMSPALKRNTEARHVQTPGTPIRGVPSRDDWVLKLNVDTLVRIVCVVLILLVVFNALLFYKLWSLESKASGLQQRNTVWHTHRNLPKNQEDWNKLLEQQQSLHEAEMERWRDILGSSIQLMNQMKTTLEELQASIERRSDHQTIDTAEPAPKAASDRTVLGS